LVDIGAWTLTAILALPCRSGIAWTTLILSALHKARILFFDLDPYLRERLSVPGVGACYPVNVDRVKKSFITAAVPI
jgi:hypothetical protein